MGIFSPGRIGTIISVVKPFAVVAALSILSLALASCSQLPTLGGKTGTEQAAAPPPDPEPEPQPPAKPQKPAKNPKALWEWNGNGRNVSHIRIDVGAQRARFFDGSDEIGWTFVASGVKSHPTPTGNFEIMEKTSKKRSNLYGKIYNAGGRVVKSDAKRGRDPVPAGGRFVGAKMPYFMRLTYDGIGLHAGRIPVPGSPASHGCIRMPKGVAPLLYKHVSLGTEVTITGHGPDYGDYAERQRLARAARAADESDADRPAELSATTEQAVPETDAAPRTSAASNAPLTPEEPAVIPSVPEEPAPSIEPIQRAAPTMQAGEEPAPSIEPIEQAAPSMQAEEEPTRSMETIEQAAPSMQAEEEPTPSIEPIEQAAPSMQTEEEPTPSIEPIEQTAPTMQSEAAASATHYASNP